jgi:putative flippase GtrA
LKRKSGQVETRPLLIQIIKFNIGGLMVISVDMGLYTVAQLLMPTALAKALSFICGAVTAYLLNKYWIFEQRQRSPKEVVRFIIGNSAALVVNITINEGVLGIWPEAIRPALIAATAGTAVFSFIVFKCWVFND